MHPAIVGQFADMLHERRSQIAAPSVHNAGRRGRELGAIDGALARIRRGSYGTCEDCGSQIQYLHLLLNPTSARCLACRPESRIVRTA
jgi:RNA polymerase-binding transcription factor DksA